MVRMILEPVRNKCFNITTGDSKQSKQATPSEKRRPKTIDLGCPPFQLLYLRPAIDDFQKKCLCRQSSIAALFWKLEGFGGDFKSRLDYTFSVFLDMKFEALSH